jgi:hypothetical protein
MDASSWFAPTRNGRATHVAAGLETRKQQGMHLSDPSDYGLVRSAEGANVLPIWREHIDDIRR